MPSVQQIIPRSARPYSRATSLIAAAGTPVSASARSSVYSSTPRANSSYPVVARAMNSLSASPAWMISRAIAFARAMSLPTSMPSHTSAHSAELVRRGSTAIKRAPFRTPRSTWWKKMGWVSRAFEPHRKMTLVSSASWYEDVPPPAPNTVARPATLGACQVRLQLSMLLLCITTRVNFWAMKFSSLVVLEQLNMPKAWGPLCRAASKPAAALVKASSQEAARSRPPSRTSGSVRRTRPSSIEVPMLFLVGGDELLDPAKPKLELVLRLRIRESDEPLAALAEGRPWKHRDAGLVQQTRRKLVLVEAGPLDVGERGERPLRTRAAHAWDLVDAVDDQVPAVLEHLHHAVHRVLRLGCAERLDRCDLRESRGARGGVDHQLVQLGRQSARSHRVAEAPAGHRVGLRQTVHEHGAFAHARARERRDVVEAVHELAVDLVGDDEQVMLLRELADEVDVFLRQHAAGRVLRSVDDDHSCPRRDERRELVEVHAKRALFAQPHRLRHSSDEVHLRRVRGIAGVGQDHLVSRLDGREQGEEEDVLRAGHQDDVVGVNLGLEHPGDEAGDRFARLVDPARGRVVRVAVLHGADSRLDDVVRRREVWFADLEMDDALALSLEPAGAGERLEGAFSAQARHALGKPNRSAHSIGIVLVSSPLMGRGTIGSSPFMGRSRAQPAGGALWAPPHSWGGGGRSPPEGNCGLLPIHGEVAGAARRRGTVGSSPFMGRWRAQPAGGALWAPPHSWGGGGRSPPEGLVDPDQRSAINTQRLAGDVARLARAEEGTCGADLAGFAEPLHGRPLLHLRQIAEAAQGVRADGIWREAVDRYPVGRELQRQRLRHPGDRGPQRVREDESWNRLADRDGGDEDDPALVRFLEVRQRRRHQAHRAHQRQLIGLVPTIERRGLERPGRRPTRVHDKDV